MIADATFAEQLAAWPPERVRAAIYGSRVQTAQRTLSAGRFDPELLAAALSPAAAALLEPMAQAAARLTRQRFGNVLQFYVPLYVSNYCTNSCVYCGFNCRNQVDRCSLTVEEAVAEAQCLADEGFSHLLLVSGEDRRHVPVDYFEELARALSPRFASLNIEIYPLETEEYARLVHAGVDTLTLYQETYDREVYSSVHPTGLKRDFDRRLDAVERGARGGMTFIGIGALLGLTDWRLEAFYVGLHARYLQQRYWRQNVSISFPRMRPAAGQFTPPYPVDDAALVQIMCALRLQLPDAGMVLSTREPAALRDRLVRIAVTRISAGSRTTPGGYRHGSEATEQFEVQDHRSLAEVAAAVARLGFDPVTKDWDRAYHVETEA